MSYTRGPWQRLEGDDFGYILSDAQALMKPDVRYGNYVMRTSSEFVISPDDLATILAAPELRRVVEALAAGALHAKCLRCAKPGQRPFLCHDNCRCFDLWLRDAVEALTEAERRAKA